MCRNDRCVPIRSRQIAAGRSVLTSEICTEKSRAFVDVRHAIWTLKCGFYEFSQMLMYTFHSMLISTLLLFTPFYSVTTYPRAGVKNYTDQILQIH